ncbi:unnamed protein product [Haemonchus placei]|uniref:Uncharacterized protein n=1 Tax=Haemonchus placei TaxID=6290 RepID=A0A0N4WKP1_HAEPC|nr:unnamed protein product [Haemonchus placei]
MPHRAGGGEQGDDIMNMKFMENVPEVGEVPTDVVRQSCKKLCSDGPPADLSNEKDGEFSGKSSEHEKIGEESNV